MKHIGLLGGLLLLLATGLNAQGVAGIPMGMSGVPDVEELQAIYDQKVGKKPQTDEESLEMIQAHMLETLFLKPIFSEGEGGFGGSFSVGDDDEDSLFNTQEFSMLNDILVKEIAKQMAKKDMLGLKRKYLKKGIQRFSPQ